MDHSPTNHSPTNAFVVLEALFSGFDVRLGDRHCRLGSNLYNEPCIYAKVLIDEEDDDGNEVENDCFLEVNIDLGDFLLECSRLEDSYITELAHKTALAKLRKT
jgi:hypothetical protein